MFKIGQPPYLECSSKGDKRFSAFYAKVDGIPIEILYQRYKKFEDGTTGLDWRAAKGRVPTNIEECRVYYSELWDRYISDNPELQQILIESSGLSDIFGQPGHACQAAELWRIREELLNKRKSVNKI
jgi:hypothetical protein